MKKLFLAAVAVMMTALSVNAQVKVVSPHPDLDIQIKRCAYADGLVVVDLVATNYGSDTEILFKAGSFYSHVIEDAGSAYDAVKLLYTITPIDPKATSFSYLNFCFVSISQNGEVDTKAKVYDLKFE